MRNGYMDVGSFKQAMKVVDALTDAGYEVLISWDGEYHTYADETGIKKEKYYRIEFVHQKYDDDYFVLNSEVEEQLRLIKVIEESKNDELSTLTLDELKKELGIKK
jgi:hypothetical protein